MAALTGILNFAKWWKRPELQIVRSSPRPEPTGPAELSIEGGAVLNLSEHAAYDVRLERDGQTIAELDCLPSGCQWKKHDATGCTVRWMNGSEQV